MAEPEERKREGTKSDRRWPWLRRENAYRDVWLLAITLLLAWTASIAVGTSRDAEQTARESKVQSETNRALIDRIDRSRDRAIRDSCELTEAANDVLRTILLESLRIRRALPTPPGELTYRDAVHLTRRLMKPLGGLRRLTQEEQDARCAARVRRARTLP